MARAGSLRMTVHFDGLLMNRFKRLIGRGDDLYRDETRRVLKEATDMGAVLVRQRAPIGETRTLVSSVATKIDESPLPLWAKVTADAANNGFRYGWRLQAQKKQPRPLYRSGRFVGRQTFRWFTRPKPKMLRWLNTVGLPAMARRLEARWRR